MFKRVVKNNSHKLAQLTIQKILFILTHVKNRYKINIFLNVNKNPEFVFN